ncbi:cupin domain-containing protein [Natronomonas sp. F2-12]|jgi:quercetin dioxygenase-like cupin family protein|uniref:Cupin domain-containing protein n=1 Tax=Natronomonas aquatica TaxID=2841590 RepID=A0A9R1D438_9EURY|nr:cupin domain-containing protein [Natronomonas aquatica]MCQ4332954.1 cupin domain-containing protein [Natronomonas aquatica]
MPKTQPEPVIKRAEDVEYETLSVADGASKAVILDESDGAPNFRMRRYRLEPGAEVPKHTNGIEHEVHAVTGEYVVGIEDEEHSVSAGDSILIPAGTVHWFRNETDEESAFVCMVPNGDAGIELLEEE